MEYGNQLFIAVLTCMFLKQILANYAQLNYNSLKARAFRLFSTPYSALYILRIQIY